MYQVRLAAGQLEARLQLMVAVSPRSYLPRLPDISGPAELGASTTRRSAYFVSVGKTGAAPLTSHLNLPVVSRLTERSDTVDLEEPARSTVTPATGWTDWGSALSRTKLNVNLQWRLASSGRSTSPVELLPILVPADAVELVRVSVATVQDSPGSRHQISGHLNTLNHGRAHSHRR